MFSIVLVHAVSLGVHSCLVLLAHSIRFRLFMGGTAADLENLTLVLAIVPETVLLKCGVCVFQALLRWIDDEPNDTSRATPRNSSDHVNLPKPVEAFKDWREWIVKCIAVLEK